VRDAQAGKVSDWGLRASPDNRYSDDEKALIYNTYAQVVRQPGADPSARPVILELAAGPGGGFLPLILLHDPEAQVLLNDILYPLLQEWQAVLRTAGAGPNVGFVAADARQLPLRSASIDVISGAVPFIEVLAPERAIAEAYRVLRPGGRLVEHEGVLEPQDTARLSPRLRAYIEENMPAWLSGAAPILRAVGFVEVEETLGSAFELSPEEGTMPAMAAKEGVSLRSQWRLVSARKPSVRSEPVPQATA
jgi:ubiquinone/menaquinone biosynthesis C-methylase UbiE